MVRNGVAAKRRRVNTHLQPFSKCTASDAAKVIQRAFRSRVCAIAPLVCPITQEAPPWTPRYTLVEPNGGSFAFEPRTLILYFLSSARIHNPVTRRPLYKHEVQRLAKIATPLLAKLLINTYENREPVFKHVQQRESLFTFLSDYLTSLVNKIIYVSEPVSCMGELLTEVYANHAWASSFRRAVEDAVKIDLNEDVSELEDDYWHRADEACAVKPDDTYALLGMHAQMLEKATAQMNTWRQKRSEGENLCMRLHKSNKRLQKKISRRITHSRDNAQKIALICYAKSVSTVSRHRSRSLFSEDSEDSS